MITYNFAEVGRIVYNSMKFYAASRILKSRSRIRLNISCGLCGNDLHLRLDVNLAGKPEALLFITKSYENKSSVEKMYNVVGRYRFLPSNLVNKDESWMKYIMTFNFYSVFPEATQLFECSNCKHDLLVEKRFSFLRVENIRMTPQ